MKLSEIKEKIRKDIKRHWANWQPWIALRQEFKLMKAKRYLRERGIELPQVQRKTPFDAVTQ